MKKILLLFALLAIATGAMSQIKVTTSGNVGIGTNNPTQKFHVSGKAFISDKLGVGNTDPQHKLDMLWGTARLSLWGADALGYSIVFNGENQWGAPQLISYGNQLMLGNANYPVNASYVNYFYYKNMYQFSDERLKENIKPMGRTLSKLLEIEGKSYSFKKDENADGIPDFEAISEKETFGFIAQDLERIFPELVLAPNPTNSYYAVDYVGMIPVLVEAIKEQQLQIENLQTLVSQREFDFILLQEQLSNCCLNNNENSAQSLSNGNLQNVEKAKLYQNAPNPFSANTEISCFLPETAAQATLYVYNLQGIELRSYPITQTGYNTITVYASELPAGMYLYTLIVDNEIMDTKRMILTK